MRRYWDILKHYKKGLIICPFVVLIATTCEAIQPLLMAKVIDEGVMNKDLTIIYTTGLYMIIISIVSLLASVINIYV